MNLNQFLQRRGKVDLSMSVPRGYQFVFLVHPCRSDLLENLISISESIQWPVPVSRKSLKSK